MWMPSSITHQILAEKICEALSENVKKRIANLPEYYLGAQGGDVLYFYNMTSREKNFGKYFHRRNIYGVFCSFLRSVQKGDGRVCSYVAGYIVHYAADTVFHPYVYWLSEREKRRTGRKKDNFHARIESDLDTYFIQKHKGIKVAEYRFPLRYEELALSSVYQALSDAVAAGEGEPPLEKKPFLRAVKRYIRYQRLFLDPRERRRKAVYAAEKLLHVRHVFSFLFHRENFDERFLNAQGEEWFYPAAPKITSHDNADELFERAFREGVRLIEAFFAAADGDGELNRGDFSKHFLAGVAEEKMVRTEKGV